jgi:hypothetical protein
MDIAAGSAICRGDNNYIGNAYMSLPIAITVEGANIMTRSFQIIGHGLTRCHPHMLDLIKSLQAPKSEEKEATAIFVKQFHKVVGHGLSNFGLSVTRGLSSTVSTKIRSKKAYRNGDKLLEYHEKQLLRLSANFALTADLCFTLGGALKFEELLMGRLADALGAIYLGYATLHHYQRRRGIEGLEALTEHAMLGLEKEAQDAGADYLGLDEFLQKIKDGWTNVDVIITMPSVMGKLGPLGKILGPRGLMPNPKTGTVTMDVAKAVSEVKAGKIDFKVEKTGIIHASIGKVSFDADKIYENSLELIQNIIKLKPNSSKGTYLKSISMSSTMSPGINIDTNI